MNLQFALTFQDYRNAMHLHAKSNWWRCTGYFAARFVLPFLGILLIPLGLLISGNGIPWIVPAFFVGLGIFFVFYPLYYRFRLKKCYLRTRTGAGENSVDLGEERIQIHAENLNSELDWKAVQFYREDRNIFMLYLAPAKFVAIPKRVLTPEQVSEMESLLERVSRTHPD